jgi:hypothetical protein
VPQHIQIVTASDLQETLDTYRNRTREELKRLEQLVDAISKECRVEGSKFSFFDLPDFLVKQQLRKSDLQNAIELINAAKEHYRESKADVLNVNLDDKVVITEDDLPPLELLSYTLNEKQEKFKVDLNYIVRFLSDIFSEVRKKQLALKVENEKVKLTIESNIIINRLNEFTEGKAINTFTHRHKTKMLAIALNKPLHSASEVINVYHHIMNIDASNSFDFKARLDDHMSKFNKGKISSDHMES